jgi:hypothetical protein
MCDAERLTLLATCNHLEEFIGVGAANRRKRTLQQRCLRIARKMEHASVELQKLNAGFK